MVGLIGISLPARGRRDDALAAFFLSGSPGITWLATDMGFKSGKLDGEGVSIGDAIAESAQDRVRPFVHLLER